MPWTINDVDKHKKGLTPSQKRQWIRIANAIYDSCLSGGENDKTCAPKAIRIANSKLMEDMVTTLRRTAKTLIKRI